MKFNLRFVIPAARCSPSRALSALMGATPQAVVGRAIVPWLIASIAPCMGLAAGAHAQVALSDQLELPRLMDLCAQRLKFSIQYDAALLKGTVTLRQGVAASEEELWSLANQLLVGNGFTTIRPHGDNQTFSVVKLEAAAAQARLYPDTAAFLSTASGPRPGFSAVVVKVVNRPAKEIAESIRLILSKSTGTVSEIAAGAPAAATPASGAAVGAAGNPLASAPPTSPAPPSPPVPGVGGMLVIADLTPRVEQAIALIKSLDTPQERVVVEEVSLKYLAAGQLVTLATQVATKQAAVSGHKSVGDVVAAAGSGGGGGGGGNSVLIVAPESQLAVWRELIAQLDKREPVLVSNYSAKYFGIKEVAKLVDQTIKETGASAADERFRVVIDELTGTLVITATPTQHERIVALMQRLDSVAPATRRPMRTYVIKNRPVREMTDVVNKLMENGVLDVGSASSGSGTTGDAAAPPATAKPNELSGPSTLPSGVSPANPVGGTSSSLLRPPTTDQQAGAATARKLNTGRSPAIDRALTLTADEPTNTLIAVGEPRALDQLGALLATLDIRQPQVMLQVLLLSLTDSQTLALGLEFEKLGKSGDAQIRLSSLFGIGGINGNSTTTAPGGTGGSIAVLSPGEFSIVVRALETLNNGRSLSMPHILVGNNQKGEFNAVTQAPVSTTVTPSSQVTTTSFGGYEPAGTTVSVQPQIAEGDHLTINYSVTLSSFTGTASAGLPPPRQENRLQSQVSIPDAYTVAIGGIDLVTAGEGTTQVPLLGSIPIIGEAFKNRNNNQSRTRFFAFIRAEVMRGSGYEDLKYASDQAIKQAKIDDGFPSVEPLVIR